MSIDKKNDSAVEELFDEYKKVLARAEKVKDDALSTKTVPVVEYLILKENLEKLLKTAVRISKLGDKAQHKLMKYKELLDTLRNLD